MSQSQQVQAKEAQLRSLYSRVFDAFRNINPSRLNDDQEDRRTLEEKMEDAVREQHVAELDDDQKDRLPLLRKNLEPVETISLVQIAAVMNAVDGRGYLSCFG